jgi:hypothetical protein
VWITGLDGDVADAAFIALGGWMLRLATLLFIALGMDAGCLTFKVCVAWLFGRPSKSVHLGSARCRDCRTRYGFEPYNDDVAEV